MVAVCSSSRKDGTPLLRRRAASAAATYFRWYYADGGSFRAADPRTLSLAALCLASKVHEMPVQVQGLLYTATCLKTSWHEPPTLAAVLYMEVDLLAKVNAALYTFDPTPALLAALESAGLKGKPDVVQTAWALLNDSYLTRAHLLHPPHDVAVACVLCAARIQGQEIDSWLHQADIDHVSVYRATETIVHGLQGDDGYREGSVDHDMCRRYLALLDPIQPNISS